MKKRRFPGKDQETGEMAGVPVVPLAQISRTALILGAPAIMVLAGLVATESLSARAALGGGAVILTALFGLAYLILTDLRAVATFLRAGTEGEVPRLFFLPLARGIIVAALSLRSRSRHRLAEARRLTQFHDSILASLPVPLVIVDPAGVVRRINAAACALLGKDATEQPFVSIVRAPALVEAVEQVLGGERRRTTHFSLTGSLERHFEGVVEALPLGKDAAPSAVVLLHDVTNLVLAETMRADFVANASHELKTPLTSILGFIETLQGPARDDVAAQERFLAIMHQQAQRMRRLVDDLLSLSRIELREHMPPTETVFVGKIISSLAEALHIQAKTKGITVNLHIPGTLPAVIGDFDELTQVFQNLLSNAIKYGRAQTEVTISATTVAQGPVSMPFITRLNCVAVSVTDQGEGIAKEHLPRLTERFYRVDTARSRQLGGTGLGLAIVKHIVARHRGALTIDSIVGKGSVFTVFLPSFSADKEGNNPPSAGRMLNSLADDPSLPQNIQ